MAYYVKYGEENGILRLYKNPSAKSWAILTMLLSIGGAASLFTSENFIWRTGYLCCTLFIGLTCMDDFQECILEKKKERITFYKRSLLQKLLSLSTISDFYEGHLVNVQYVSVDSNGEYGNNGKMKCRVVVCCQDIENNQNLIYPVTDGFYEECESHYEVAKKIADYLGLIEIQEDQEEDKDQGIGEDGECYEEEEEEGSFSESSRCNEEDYDEEEYADDQSESDYGDNDYDEGSSSQDSLEADIALNDQSEEVKSFPV